MVTYHRVLVFLYKAKSLRYSCWRWIRRRWRFHQGRTMSLWSGTRFLAIVTVPSFYRCRIPSQADLPVSSFSALWFLRTWQRRVKSSVDTDAIVQTAMNAGKSICLWQIMNKILSGVYANWSLVIRHSKQARRVPSTIIILTCLLGQQIDIFCCRKSARAFN